MTKEMVRDACASRKSHPRRMPLKSATCGRELEAGLRRRPGSNNVTFDGEPLDGFFVMHNLICGQGKILALSLAKIIAVTMLQQRS